MNHSIALTGSLDRITGSATTFAFVTLFLNIDRRGASLLSWRPPALPLPFVSPDILAQIQGFGDNIGRLEVVWVISHVDRLELE